MTPGSRSSAKRPSGEGTSPDQAEKGSKHGTEPAGSPEAKRAKTSTDGKEHQLTIEEQIALIGSQEADEQNGDRQSDTKSGGENSNENADAGQEAPNGESSVPDNDEVGLLPPSRSEDTSTSTTAVESKGHPATPSSVLEKGIIYFFYRRRVGVDQPEDVNDIARTHLLLRPIAADAKLGAGPIGDAGNARLIALPKKTLPQGGQDRFMAFVEKAGMTFDELKEEFLTGEDYGTKTEGERHTQEATPVGEGVYALTTTGRESHLVYLLTVPREIGEVQKELGMRERGSFVLSTKNPDGKGPAYAQLPEKAQFSEDIMKEFRSRRWMPTQPRHLDYANAQFLLIGESSGVERATEPQKQDQKTGKDEPLEELEKLEDEDTKRMEGLTEQDATRVYADLQVHVPDGPELQTTF